MSASGRKNDENVVKRKSYYSFAKRYPGSSGDSGYLIGESRTMKRRENIKKAVFVLVLVLLFVCAYVAVSASMYASEAPYGGEGTTAAVSVQTDDLPAAAISGEVTEQ